MSRALLRAACATLLLVGGFVLYLLFAYAVKRSAADAQAAQELRQALEIYGRLVIVRGLVPTLWLALPFALLLERAVPALAQSGRGRAAALAIAAGVAALVVAAVLLPAQFPGAPHVVYSGAWNFVATWLEITAGVVAAALLARWLLPPRN
jgi:hypothetical protein